MKFKKLYILIFAAMVFTLSSCEDYLDVDHEDIVVAEKNKQDYQTLNSSVLATYALLGDLTEQMFLSGEVRGELVVTNSNANSYIEEFNNNTFSAANPYVSARGFYSIVNNTNRLIAENKNAITTGIIDSLDYNALHSELIGLRGWTYFQILKNYGTCKYFKEVRKYPAPEIQALTYEAAVDTILADVLAVDTLSYSEFGDGANSNWNRIRVLQQTINTLVGELYMEKGEFEKAALKFEEIIRKTDEHKSASAVSSDNNFKLQTYKRSDWRSIFMGSSSNSEGLFWIFAGKEYNQFNDLQKWTATATNGGMYVVKPSQVAISNFIREGDTWRGEYSSFKTDGSQYYINKYIIDRGANENDAQFFLYRAGRVHLLWAECLNRLDERTRALEILNNGTHLGDGIYTGGVRNRVGLSPIVIPVESRDKMLWLEDKIIDELALETAFEGNRWYDLVRIAKRRNDPEWLANRVLNKFPEEEKERHRADFSMDSWYLPVFE